MTNSNAKPEFEGQIVKFESPHARGIILYDVAKRNKYGKLEWWAVNTPTENQALAAMDEKVLMGNDGDFLSKEQAAVVTARKSDGYECEKMPNDFWLCYKGRHTMLINGLGYDVHIKRGML